MKNTKFCELSSLVLVDTLAALPMEHVVRMARLGHERLRHACSLKWVTARMTDVTFGKIVRAHQTGGDIAAAFCTKSLMKRLMGKITIAEDDFSNASYLDAFVELANQVTGRLHCNIMNPRFSHMVYYNRYRKFATDIAKQTNLTYCSINIHSICSTKPMTKMSLTVVFDHESHNNGQYHIVYYRPALLNGHHIVDVVRAVLGPAVVSEAELDRVRAEATRRVTDRPGWGGGWGGVLLTWWSGAAEA